jgi:YD repeat-containing protein
LIDILSYNYKPDKNQLDFIYEPGADEGVKPQNPDNYGYDGNGNMVRDNSKGISQIVYDWRNLPTEIYFSDGKFIRYRYDASGKRIYKFVATPVPPPSGKGGDATGTTERTDYERGADGALVALYENGNGTPTYYYHANGYIDAGSGARYYELRDQLGNIRSVVGETGSVVEQNDFYAYGAVRESGRSAGDGSNRI